MNPTLDLIKSEGKKTGLAISPGTPLSAVAPFLSSVDLLLVMTVKPGFGGQQFMREELSKVQELRRLIDENGSEVDVQVDGGVNFETAPEAIAAGANILVAGTAAFADGEGSYRTNLARLRGSAAC